MKGKPIHYIDPKEGNFSLVEAAAVVKRVEQNNRKLKNGASDSKIWAQRFITTVSSATL